MKKYFLYLMAVAFMLSCKKDDSPDPEIPKEKEVEVESTENKLLQLQGPQLVDANKNPVYLQGMAFNNFVWGNVTIPPEHHTEVDYQRVKAMGMNVVRFYMNYSYFEDDSNPYTYRQSGWDWLDKNITWAKNNGIYLVLNMHVPQGGYQSQGEGIGLWNNQENQNRLAALWKAIASRYINEVQIAGFGLVNEPVPSESMQQWSTLAQRLINNIREVNKNHLIFVERAIYVSGNYIPDDNLNFPQVTGQNLVYEFHGYDPYFYTHQKLEFANLGDGGKYPDEAIIETSNSEWYTASFENPKLPSDSSEWNYYEGVRFNITDAKIHLIAPALVAAGVSGRVYFDDIVVKEYGPSGDFVRDIYADNLNAIDGWIFWSENGSGTNAISTTEGNEDSSSIYIDGATGDANMTNRGQQFEAKQGYSYQINGWMKGDNIADTATCLLRLDFYTSEGSLFKRNKAFLEATIGETVTWASSKNAALYMGEFGVGNPCFEEDKGGLTWVADMVDILKTNTIHFSYHSYHEDAFGLYYGTGLPDPSRANQALINWFTTNLN